MGVGSPDRERAAVVTSVSRERLSMRPSVHLSVRPWYSQWMEKEFLTRADSFQLMSSVRSFGSSHPPLNGKRAALRLELE